MSAQPVLTVLTLAAFAESKNQNGTCVGERN
jgi:hypothetical protein